MNRAAYFTSPSQTSARLMYTFVKHPKVSEVGTVPVEICHIKDERFSYRSGVYASNSENSVLTVLYKPTPDRLQIDGK